MVLQMVFAQVAGPLTWSIVALRNSLVLHSLDKASLLCAFTLSHAYVGQTWPALPTVPASCSCSFSKGENDYII